MRVVVLANASSPHTQRWATALTERGHDVHVIGIRDADIPRVSVYRVGSTRRGPVWSMLSYLRLLLGVRRMVRRIAPDVVNAHYSVTHGAIAALRRLRPLVVTVWGSDLVRGDHPTRGPKRLLNRYVLRRADAVTGAGEFLAAAVQEVAGVQAEIVPFGVDTARFAPRPFPESDHPFVIGWVKHLEPRYDPMTALAAFQRVAREHPAARLAMIGHGSMESKVERAIEDMDLTGAVEMTGGVRHDDLADVMRQFDVLINTSISESFGVVMLEAAASGVPVIATRVGGTNETVRDGITGYLVDPGDAAMLARRLTELAADPGLRRRMGSAGRDLVVADYEWRACVDRMISVLEAAAR